MKFLWTIGGSKAKSGKGYLQFMSAPTDTAIVTNSNPNSIGPSVIVSGLTFLGAGSAQLSQRNANSDVGPTGPGGPGGAHGGVALVTGTIPNTILAGDLIVVSISFIQKWNAGSLSVVNGVDTFVQQYAVDSGGGNQTSAIYSVISAGGAGANSITVTHSLSKNLRIIVSAYRSTSGFASLLGVYGGNGTGWNSGDAPIPTAPLTLFVAMSGWQDIGSTVMYTVGPEGPFWNQRLSNVEENVYYPPLYMGPFFGPIGNGAISLL